jgi:hypothetical protein
MGMPVPMPPRRIFPCKQRGTCAEHPRGICEVNRRLHGPCPLRHSCLHGGFTCLGQVIGKDTITRAVLAMTGGAVLGVELLSIFKGFFCGAGLPEIGNDIPALSSGE